MPSPSPSRGDLDSTGVGQALALLTAQIGRLERLGGPEIRAAQSRLEHLAAPEVPAAEALGRRVVPVWQGPHRGEHRLPVAAAVAVAIGLQVRLPSHLELGPGWVLPALEVGILIGLVAANPRRIDRKSRVLRFASIALIALASLANAYSAARLVTGLVNGTEGENAAHLLAAGASISVTNIIVFSLWYWEWDRGGPVARVNAQRPHPDFLFPQMATPDAAAVGWRTTYFDYLYVSFTNATAFSPTDAMPLAVWAKMLMLLQSAIALIAEGLVIARAVNLLK